MVRRIDSRQVTRAVVLDIALVIVFVLIGRASHGEAIDVAGVATTAWPFLVGLLVGWIAMRAWRSPSRVVWTAVGIYASTLVIGMLLRLASTQGVQLAFVIVAAISLAGFLLGWRLLARYLAGRRR
ncbi:MAG: conserved rane protein [Glaciihabitans sp.]|jgi:peptidoglycan/LPS O-acetylase OafA/YrhL|nr:conserved rane protein [Glaciihabitans sp.]